MADISNIADRIGLPNHMKILRVDPNNPQLELDSYTVLVNPSSYKVSYKSDYYNDQAIGAKTSSYHFNKVQNQTISIELMFDSTGSFGKIPLLSEQPVLDQVEHFLSVAYVGKTKKDNDDKVAKVMKLIWGPMEFLGLLSSVNLNYTHFDTTGAPIRAKATCQFDGGDLKFELSDYAKKQQRKAPDQRKVIDYAKQKHAINAVQKYGSYIAIVAQQPESALPKSLRIASEVAKMIIK